MLLNLLAALSLASIGAVAGIASNPQSVDDVVLDKSSLIQRKNAIGFTSAGAVVSYHKIADFDDNVVVFDAYLPCVVANSSDPYSNGDSLIFVSSTKVQLCLDSASCAYFDRDGGGYINGSLISIGQDSASLAGSGAAVLNIDVINPATNNSWAGSFAVGDYYRFILVGGYPTDAVVADYYASHQIVSGIASGLTSVQHYASSLVSGFDALALDNGALTNSMAFAFTLLGIGTAVGICKLAFSWIIGRHGM